MPAPAFLHKAIVCACFLGVSVLGHQHVQSSDEVPSVAVSRLHFITKCLSDSYTEIWQHTTRKHVSVDLHFHCSGLLPLRTFTELTVPKPSASTASCDITLLFYWQHCTTSAREILSFNRNSTNAKLSIIMCCKIHSFTVYLVAARQGKQTQCRLTQFDLQSFNYPVSLIR